MEKYNFWFILWKFAKIIFVMQIGLYFQIEMRITALCIITQHKTQKYNL